MMRIWSNDETLSVATNSVTKILYNSEQQNIKVGGRWPKSEKAKNSTDISMMAETRNTYWSAFVILKTPFQGLPESLKRWAYTLISEVTIFLPGAMDLTNVWMK